MMNSGTLPMRRVAIAADDGWAPPDAGIPSDAAIAMRGVTVSYGNKPAVFSVDATFPARAMSAIVGPNGAGKSTLLKSALDVIPRVSGEVQVFGKPIGKARACIAYVPQRASVDWDFPATAMDVVLMGLYREVGLLGRLSRQMRSRAWDCLERVGMADFGDRQIGRLSGGQQQRVFLARALAQDAELYLLDEPFAGVDAATERAIIDVLKLLKSENKAVVAVHHDLSTVRDYFDHVFFINVRSIAEGPVERAFTADNLQAAYGGRLAATHLDELSMAIQAV